METTNSITPAGLVRIEAQALSQLAERLESTMQQPFADAAARLAACVDNRQRVVVTGMGKSGLIAQKIAATLNSTGTPAQFLHPAEAIHGDLGMLTRGDLVLALSYSGETEEILRLLEILKRLGDALIAMTGNLGSSLALASDVALDCSVAQEACFHNLAPTASTTVMLAVGDALAMEVARIRGFRAEDFAQLHPGGKLGKRLRLVSQLMHTGDALPAVSPSTAMPSVIHEMSRKRLGMTTVVDNGKLLGVISDGDLRRLLEREQGRALSMTAGEVMHVSPQTIAAEALASSALAVMEERKITSLVVVSADGSVQGVLHLHDLWGLELV